MRFKPRLRDTLLANQRALDHMADMAGKERMSFDDIMPPAPKRRKPPVSQTALDMDAVHVNRLPSATKKVERYLEKDVLRSIKQLLAAHPRVKFACRQNSGSASFEAASGKWQPVSFYEIVRTPVNVTLPDLWGFLITGQAFFIEVKRPGFVKPRDVREETQAAFLDMMRSLGAIALFATDAQQVADALA